MTTRFDTRQSKNVAALPMVGSAANATLDTILPLADAEIAKLFEDRNILLTGGGTITYTGTTITFTEALKLEINSKIAGGSPVVIDLSSTTRTLSANGRMLYAIIDRIAGTATITDDAATLPAVISTNKEVMLIAKRVDAADSTKRVYFSSGTILSEGQSSKLGNGGYVYANEFGVIDKTDTTKKFLFSTSSATTSTSVTLSSNTTANRVLSLPDATDTLVGKNTPDILTNKILQQDNIDDYIDFNEETAPATPASGKVRVYAKSSDKKLYQKDSTGVESVLGSTATALIVQTKTTTYTALITDDIILADTSGGAWTLTIFTPVGNSGEVLEIKKTSSDFNILTVSPAAGNIIENASSNASTTLNTKDERIRLVSDGTNWHVLSRKTNTSPTAYTPSSTWTSNVTITGFWQRIGASIFIEVLVAVTGTPTTASLRVSIPTGLTIDTNSLTSQAQAESILGTAYVHDNGIKKYPPGKLEYTTTTALSVYYNSAATTEANVTQAAPITFGANDNIKIISFAIPISGWKA